LYAALEGSGTLDKLLAKGIKYMVRDFIFAAASAASFFSLSPLLLIGRVEHETILRGCICLSFLCLPRVSSSLAD
jgi:hypothetical protein